MILQGYNKSALQYTVGNFEAKKQQFNTPGFMPVNLSNSVALVELEITQSWRKANEQ
jgi:queuine/archaeosine tRNA-ribosyltransferase